jgi:hypothetical protein
MMGFRPRARVTRWSLWPWSAHRVVCSCGYKGRTKMTRAEAVAAAAGHMRKKHST